MQSGVLTGNDTR